MNRNRVGLVISALTIGALILGLAGLGLAAFLREAAPINIEADLLQKSTAMPAEIVHDALVDAGFTSTLYDISTYDIVVEKVQDSLDPQSVDIGVNARPVDSDRFPNVISLGTIGNIPVLIIARAGQDPITSPAQLRGKQIQIGYPGSTAADVGERILAQFNVTRGNSSLQTDKPSVAEAMVLSGESDAAVVMYSPYDDSHTEFITAPGLQIVPIPAAKAVAGRIGYVVAETLPAGAYRVDNAVPPEDISVIAVPITVVARDSVSRSAIFTIARALNARFGRGSVLSEPGEFPQFLYNIPASDAASEYYDAGIIPWQYRLLPAPVADLVIPIAVTGSILLIVAALYQLLLPEFYTVWKEIIRPRRHHRRQRRRPPEPLPPESK
jgi:hypothetical protein